MKTKSKKYAKTVRKTAVQASKKKKGASTRVTRSVSFLNPVIAHLRKKAAAQNRSVNFIVNELIANDIDRGEKPIKGKNVLAAVFEPKVKISAKKKPTLVSKAPKKVAPKAPKKAVPTVAAGTVYAPVIEDKAPVTAPEAS